MHSWISLRRVPMPYSAMSGCSAKANLPEHYRRDNYPSCVSKLIRVPKLLDGRTGRRATIERRERGRYHAAAGLVTMVRGLVERLRTCRVGQSLRRRMVGAWLMRVVKGQWMQSEANEAAAIAREVMLDWIEMRWEALATLWHGGPTVVCWQTHRNCLLTSWIIMIILLYEFSAYSTARPSLT